MKIGCISYNPKETLECKKCALQFDELECNAFRNINNFKVFAHIK